MTGVVSAAPGARGTAADRRARVAAAGAYFVQGLCFAALITQVPALQHRFGFTDAELSLVLLAVPVVAGLGSVLAGTLARRFGSAVLLRAGGLGVAAAITAAGAVGTRPGLYAVLAAVGLFLGLVDATMNMQGVAVQRRYGRNLLASFHGVWSVGGIAGALATAAAGRLHLSLLAGLASVALAGAAISLAAGPSLLRRTQETAPVPDPAASLGSVASPETAAASGPGAAPGPAAAPVIPWLPIIAVGSAMMLMYIADSATQNWGTIYLERMHPAAGVAPLGLAAYQTCMVLGRAIGDRAVARFGPVRSVAAGGAVGVAGLLLVAVAPGPAVAIAGFAVLGLGLCVVVPQSFSAAGALDPTGSGVAIARVNLFNYAGFVIGAALIGIVAENATLRWAFAVPAVLTAGIVALARSFRPRPVSNPRPVSQPPAP